MKTSYSPPQTTRLILNTSDTVPLLVVPLRYRYLEKEALLSIIRDGTTRPAVSLFVGLVASLALVAVETVAQAASSHRVTLLAWQFVMSVVHRIRSSRL